MKYAITYSERALNDLKSIHSYIAVELLAPETARNLIDKIVKQIGTLCVMPNRNPLYDEEPWRKRGLRKLIIDNFVVFYIPIEKYLRVLIVSIMYGKRDITHILDKIND